MFISGITIYSLKIHVDIKDKSVRRFFKNLVPVLSSSGAQQINLFISQAIASFIPGAISTLAYAERLYQLPLSLLGTTIGTVLLPSLSQKYSSKDHKSVYELQNNAIKLAMLFTLPATLGLSLFAHPIVHLIYERGKFLEHDTDSTAMVLVFFTRGLPAFVLLKILTQIFYANLDTKNPFKITLYSMLLNTILNLLLIQFYGINGIAIGSSVTAWLTFYIMYLKLQDCNYTKISLFSEDNITFFLKLLGSLGIMGGFVLYMDQHYHEYFYDKNILIKAFSILFTIFLSIILYFGSAYMLKIHHYFKIPFDISK